MRLHLASLSPFGPIFGMELRIASRRKRNHFLRVAYLGGLLMFLMLTYASNSYTGGGVAYQMQRQTRLSQEFFGMFGVFCVVAMGLICPVLTSTALSAERMAKTLPVLLMTPISSWQIVAGKLLSRLLTALMLIGLSIPVLAVVRLLGGVELWQMAAVLCICTAFAISSAAIGMFFSSLVNRTYAVILFSYITMLLLYLILPSIAAVFIRTGVGMLMPWTSVLLATNPVANVALLVVPSGPFARPPWVADVIVQLAFAATLLAASAMILRRFARRSGEPAVAASPAPPIADASSPAVCSSKKESPGPGRNPVLWREIRRPLIAGRWRWLGGIVIVGFLALTYAASAAAEVLDEEELQIVYGVIFNGLYWLLVAVLAATVIAQEKESDTWTVLLASPLSARQIVWGKLLGLVRRMLWPSLLIAAHFLAFGIAPVLSMQSVLAVVWVIFSFNTVWAASGIYLSLRFRKTTTAVVINLLIALVLFIVVPILLSILGALTNSNDLGEIVAWYLPYVFIAQAAQRLSPICDWDRSMWLPLTDGPMTVVGFLWAVFFVGAAHIAIAWTIIMYTIGRFDRIVGRAQTLKLMPI